MTSHRRTRSPTAVPCAARPPPSPRPALAAVGRRTRARLACRASTLRWSHWLRRCTARGRCSSGRWPGGSPCRQHATRSYRRYWRASPRRSSRRRPITRRRPIMRRRPRRTSYGRWERGRAASCRPPTGRRRSAIRTHRRAPYKICCSSWGPYCSASPRSCSPPWHGRVTASVAEPRFSAPQRSWRSRSLSSRSAAGSPRRPRRSPPSPYCY